MAFSPRPSFPIPETRSVRDSVWQIDKHDGMNVPVRIYATKPILDKIKGDRSLWQAQNVAKLPGIIDAAMVMSDGHEGYGFPIGGVAAFDPENGGVISPGGIGYDINCGVRLLATNLDEKDVRPHLKALISKLFDNVPSGVGSKSRLRLQDRELEEATTVGAAWAVERGLGTRRDLEHTEENGQMKGADYSAVSDMAKKRGKPQFGTLGSGNHFLEIQKVDKILDPETAKAFGLTHEGQVTIMFHCGSRGFGHQICDDNLKSMIKAARDKYNLVLPDPELACVPLGTPEADSYLGQMRAAINYAFNNRQVIAHWTRESFAQVLGGSWEDYDLRQVYDVCHNGAKFEKHEVDGKEREVCVHRKGATRAFWKGRPEVPAAYRSVGQPVLIPGSMNTASYVLVGLPGAKETFGSSCHGAGRVMSRAQAMRTFKTQDIAKEMEAKGQAIRAMSNELLAEEAGGAYKDVDAVVQSVQNAGISRIVARLVPLGVVKG